MVRPRTFFLNEQHELKGGEKEGGGGLPKYAPIDWATKGRNVQKSLKKAEDRIRRSRDPLRDKRYFLLAKPELDLVTEAVKKRQTSDGRYLEDVDYAKGDSLLFERLGLDLLQVNEDGSATVHVMPDQFSRLMATSGVLDEFGKREQNRWAKIHSFDVVPSNLRLDKEWIAELPSDRRVTGIVELQPLLTRGEVDMVLRAISQLLEEVGGGKLVGSGTDYSGRQWLRGEIMPNALQAIADMFYSVQSLHPLLFSRAASSALASNRLGERPAQTGRIPPRNISQLPVVGILDTGVPIQHPTLAKYSRGQFNAPNSAGKALGSHGSFVASRVVFGDLDMGGGIPDELPAGDCRYYDIRVADYEDLIHDKSVVPAIQAVLGAAPDIRVFNLSFDDMPLGLISPVERENRLALVQDLDNLIFANDILAVISAGNSKSGVVPNSPYPDHCDDPNWELGPWARSFNALTCGSDVQRISTNGLVRDLDWPSPFSRVGPGLCESPKPDFSDHGGNITPAYKPAKGLGVWGCSEKGRWEDRSGTSHAAPLLARQCAFAIDMLMKVCSDGAHPYSATAKAFLTLVAETQNIPQRLEAIRSRTLGRGRAYATRLNKPLTRSVVLIWQGVLETPKDLARVRIPIPQQWWAEAEQPCLRVVTAWDTPVNAAAHHLWGCRKVSLRLKSRPDARALSGTRGGLHRSYPLSDRCYNLKNLPEGTRITGDEWLAEIDYEVKAADYPAFDVTPQQRVAFAAELFDLSEAPLSPQDYVQSLPIAKSMNRLSIPPAIIRAPVIIKSRL